MYVAQTKDNLPILYASSKVQIDKLLTDIEQPLYTKKLYYISGRNWCYLPMFKDGVWSVEEYYPTIQEHTTDLIFSGDSLEELEECLKSVLKDLKDYKNAVG